MHGAERVQQEFAWLALEDGDPVVDLDQPERSVRPIGGAGSRPASMASSISRPLSETSCSGDAIP